MKPFYVDENDNTYLGEEAEEKLRGRNDLRFFRQREGVLEVDETRWKQAQQYERRTWMEAGGLAAREDRNTEHEIHFDHYAAIAGSNFISSLYKNWKKPAPFEASEVEMGEYFWYFDSSKAEEELNFTTREPAETLQDTIKYLRENFLGEGVFK